MTFFKNLFIFLCVVAPLTTNASVGITPAAINEEIRQNDTEEYSLTFMRDDKDTETEMMIYVYSENGFLVTEGRAYYMGVGDRSLEIPYRVSSAGYEPGNYEGVLYIQPDRVDEYAVEGNAVKVQAGVKSKITVLEEQPEQLKWHQVFYKNLQQNLMLARANSTAFVAALFN